MINPFISNYDNNYLLRKNYQIITKPKPTNPPQTYYSATKIQLLQNRNPFKKETLHPSMHVPIPLSQSRSLSSSQIYSSRFQNKTRLGKSRLIEEVDGWKRELQKDERKRLKVYGVQGLRYNAYPSFSANQDNVQNEYYGSSLNNLQLQHKPTGYFNTKQNKNSSKANFYHQQANKKNSFQERTSRRGQEIQSFQDEIVEDSFNKGAHKQGAQNKGKYEVDAIMEESIRQSKLVDMFGSDFDGFKRQMKHNSNSSYYGSGEEDLMESKREAMKHSKSKFSKDHLPYHPTIFQSQVLQLKMLIPSTVAIKGQIYHRLQI